MTDIKDKKDIINLIDLFYQKVRKDPVIGGVFASRIQDESWPEHLEVMYGFWNTVLFGKQEYRGNPFSKHADLPINNIHFERWLELMYETVDEKFKGAKADEVKHRAKMMGDLFSSKLEHIRKNDQFRNIM